MCVCRLAPEAVSISNVTATAGEAACRLVSCRLANCRIAKCRISDCRILKCRISDWVFFSVALRVNNLQTEGGAMGLTSCRLVKCKPSQHTATG